MAQAFDDGVAGPALSLHSLRQGHIHWAAQSTHAIHPYRNFGSSLHPELPAPLTLGGGGYPTVWQPNPVAFVARPEPSVPLLLLDPVSDEFYWPPRRLAAPLGTILVARLDGLENLPALLADKLFHPWCPTCLILVEERVPLRWMETLAASRRQFGTVHQPPGIVGNADAIRQAIRGRTPPAPDTLVRYIRRRTERGDAVPALLACFEPPGLAPALSESTLARHLRDFGEYTARDWRSLNRLLLATGRAPTALERVAHALGLDPRTLRADARRFLGEYASQAAEWPGWEWKLEAALRRGGYPLRSTPRTTPPTARHRSAPHQLA